jgi:hypothetical protein
MKKQAKIWLSLSIGIILILAIIAMIFSFGSIRQETIQASNADMSILSISKTTINGKEGFRILASASKGAEQLSINWNPSFIQSFLDKAGLTDYEATKAITGSFKYDKQSLTFPYQPSAGSSKIYKQARFVDKGLLVFQSCSTDKCTSELKTGEELLYNGRIGGALSNCYCVIASEVAEYGQFGGSSIGDYQVTFSIDGIGSVKTTRDTRSANLGTTASIRWEGQLDSLDKLNAPDYDLALFNSQITMLDKGTYNKIYTDLNKHCGVLDYANNYAGDCRVAGWTLDTQLNNIINSYNSQVNSYWIDRFDYYKNTGVDHNFIDIAILNSSGLTVFTKQPTSYPVFTIDLDAQRVGIIKLSGKPSIINTNNCEFNSNNIGKTSITVKNIGESQGCFNIGFENCNLISGYTAGSNSLGCFGVGETKDIELNVAGSTTSTNGETGSCLVTVYDVNTPSIKDTYDLSCKVNYNPGSLCADASTKCSPDYTQVMRCQGEPRSYQLLTRCTGTNKCQYDSNGNAVCLVPSNNQASSSNGSCSTFDIFCKINAYFLKLRIALAILIGIIGGALAGWLSLSFTDKLTTKQRTGIYLIAMAILGVGLGFIFFAYFWFALIVLFILFLVKMFLPDKKNEN